MKKKKKKTTTSAVILANAVQRRLSMSSSLYLSKDRVQRVREGDNTQHPKTTIKNTPRRKKKEYGPPILEKKKGSAYRRCFYILFLVSRKKR